MLAPDNNGEQLCSPTTASRYVVVGGIEAVWQSDRPHGRGMLINGLQIIAPTQINSL